MARTRLLKPDFFKSEDIAALSPFARLFFQGLWCLADKDGRLLDRPRRLALEILPYDAQDGEKLLAEIAANRGLITRYIAADGRRCIQITNFGKHQSPHHKEPSLGLPGPELGNVGQSQDLPSKDTESHVEFPSSGSGSSSGSGGSLPAPAIPDAGATRPTPERQFAATVARGQVTGFMLATAFGFVREAEVPGSLPWDVPRGAEKGDNIAAACMRDPGVAADVIPTMRLLFAKARRGEGFKPSEVLSDPSCGFGVWCSGLTRLREEIHGRTPKAPAFATGPPADIRHGHARAETARHQGGERKL